MNYPEVIVIISIIILVITCVVFSALYSGADFNVSIAMTISGIIAVFINLLIYAYVSSVKTQPFSSLTKEHPIQ